MFYGILTIVFVISPFITSFFLTMSAICITRSWDWSRLPHCFFHLPLVQIIKHLIFLTKLNNAMEDMSLTEDFAKSVIEWVKSCPELNAKKEWDWEMIQTHMKDGDLTEAESKRLKCLFEERDASLMNRAASRLLKKIVIDEQKKKTNELGYIEASIQEFKMMEAFLESFPQFVLQTCATINRDPTFESVLESNQLKLTLLTSLVSVIASVTTTFMKMPHISNEQKVPISQYWKNYLMVGFLMLLMVTPRLVVISIYFASCRHGISVVFITIALATYAIPYFGYVGFRGHGKETRKLIVLNFATSLIGPCIVINPTSSLIFVSFLLSMVGHLVLLGTVQISSLNTKHIFLRQI